MTNQLCAASLAVQKLEKKLRQLRNRGEATEDDVTDARAARAALARIFDRHNLKRIDLDSRAEKKERRKDY